jgi:hypothetical protein
LSLLTSCNDSAKREISFHWALPRARRPRGLRRRVGGDTGEWAPSGRCSPSLFGSSPRSAWKRNSAKFTVASNRSDAALSTRQQHGGTPSASKRSDLVAGVAPLCIKELRLVTTQLPENSANFAFKEFCELRPNGVLRSLANGVFRNFGWALQHEVHSCSAGLPTPEVRQRFPRR